MRLQELEFDFFDKNRTGDIMARMTGDTDAIRHFLAWVIYMIFENGTTFIFAIIMLFTIQVKLSLIMLAVTPAIAFFAYKLANEVRPTFFWRLGNSFQNSIQWFRRVSGNRVIKAFAKEDYEILKLTKQNDAYKKRNLESAFVWGKYLPVLDSLAGLLTVVMILVGGTMVIKGSLTIGQFVAFNSFDGGLSNPMRMVGWLINDVQRFSACTIKIIAVSNNRAQNKKL